MSCYCGKLPVRRRKRTASIYEKIIVFRERLSKRKKAAKISFSGQILDDSNANKNLTQ